jgi:nucleoside-diphosphate-sugar epimerase
MGFIGGHLIPALEARGHSVTLALRDRSRERRLLASAPNTRWTAVVGEIGPETHWRRALTDADAVIHLAARAHVLDQSAKDEESFMRINAGGTARLVEHASRAGVQRFVLMSSIGAVTDASDQLVTLETPCAPVSPYGRSKLEAERALVEHCRESDMEWTILRPTLVYGPGNPGNIARLVSLVRRGWPLPLGAIRNRRSFAFVENLVDATIAVLTHDAARAATFFVADGEDLSTPELIAKIAQHAETHTKLVPVPLLALETLARGAQAIGVRLPFDGETLRRLGSSLFVDTAPLRALGWTPRFSVDEGLRSMLGVT